VKKNLLHTIRLTVLSVLTWVVFGAAVGSYWPKQQPTESKQECTKKQGQTPKNELTVSPSAEAVVVSNLAPDFSKAVFFSFQSILPFTFLIFEPSYLAVSTNHLFKTLFTHIISPNAP